MGALQESALLLHSPLLHLNPVVGGMGCAGSTEDGQPGYSEQAVVNNTDTASAETVEVEPEPVGPPPTGEEVWILVGDKILLNTFLPATATVQDVSRFVEWQLGLQKTLPDGYELAKLKVHGVSSPFVLNEGLLFHPEELCTELEGWEEGERFLLTQTEQWEVKQYMQPNLMEDLKGVDTYWAALQGTKEGLVIEWNTDLRSSDIPAGTEL